MLLQFTTEHDPETGELGWKDSRIARNSPYGPISWHYGLAHDSIEHFALETVADEIMAHAAMYWIRYQSGHVNSYGYNLKLEHIGEEWASLARAMSEHNLEQAPRTCKLDDSTEEDISEIVQVGRVAIRSEFGDSDFSWQDLADAIEKTFRGWFRVGYRAAAKRWGRWDMTPGEVSVLYDKVADLFKKNVPQYEGQRVELSISKNGEVRLHEIEEEVY
jgi:hypothetical protein